MSQIGSHTLRIHRCHRLVARMTGGIRNRVIVPTDCDTGAAITPIWVLYSINPAVVGRRKCGVSHVVYHNLHTLHVSKFVSLAVLLMISRIKQVVRQLSTRHCSPLPLNAALRRSCCRCAVQQSIAVYCPSGAQQQTHSSAVRRANDGTD